jgi:hypothetical protein
MNSLVIMEIQQPAPRPQGEALHVDKCAVPAHDPDPHAPQRLSFAGRLLQKLTSERVPRVTVRPVLSNESESNAATRQKARFRNQQPNGRHMRLQQGNAGNGQRNTISRADKRAIGIDTATNKHALRGPSDRIVPDQAAVRDSKLRLMWWKRAQSQQAIRSPNGPPTDPATDLVTTLTQSPPAIVAGEESTVNPLATVPDISIPPPTTTNKSGTNIVAQLDQHTVINQAKLSNDSGINEVQANAGPHSLRSAGQESHTVLEPIGSGKLFSPEKGVYVGKLMELPPPERLQEEWRLTIRPQLLQNLMMVIVSLPKALPREQTIIEPEFYMSGIHTQGHPAVSLRPTIWIRCGSDSCRKAVQKAAADLSRVNQYRVHVTLHAPRRSSSSKQAPLGLARGTTSSSTDMIDQISPVDPVQPGPTTSTDIDSVEIWVNSLHGNHQSACGLLVKLSGPTGTSRHCTLGGLLMLNDTILGLTTAHGIYDSGHEVSESSRQTRDYEAKRWGKHFLRSNNRSLVFPRVSATLWAMRFGKSQYQSNSTTPWSTSRSVGACHDFALLKLQPQVDVSARNAYLNSGSYVDINTTSRDMSARAVKLVCSAEDVKPGHLLDGEAVILDKVGYWETKKIQLEAPLSKSCHRFTSQSYSTIYSNV